MKKSQKIFLFIGILILTSVIVFILRSPEDSWIKDEKGIWIKHGNPSVIPDNVKEQQNALRCASELYNSKKLEEMEFSSQCLGVCSGYAIDIVNVPRISGDNLIENQCEDCRNGDVEKFIELDKDGNVVRVMD